MGYKGVNITCTCFPDKNMSNPYKKRKKKKERKNIDFKRKSKCYQRHGLRISIHGHSHCGPFSFIFSVLIGDARAAIKDHQHFMNNKTKMRLVALKCAYDQITYIPYLLSLGLLQFLTCSSQFSTRHLQLATCNSHFTLPPMDAWFSSIASVDMIWQEGNSEATHSPLIVLHSKSPICHILSLLRLCRKMLISIWCFCLSFKPTWL